MLADNLMVAAALSGSWPSIVEGSPFFTSWNPWPNPNMTAFQDLTHDLNSYPLTWSAGNIPLYMATTTPNSLAHLAGSVGTSTNYVNLPDNNPRCIKWTCTKDVGGSATERSAGAWIGGKTTGTTYTSGWAFLCGVGPAVASLSVMQESVIRATASYSFTHGVYYENRVIFSGATMLWKLDGVNKITYNCPLVAGQVRTGVFCFGETVYRTRMGGVEYAETA